MRSWYGFRWACCLIVFAVWALLGGCSHSPETPPDKPALSDQAGQSNDDLKMDPATGIPYAFTFQAPISGFTASDFCFGFGSLNTNFCLKAGPNGCEAYGHHLGVDSCVVKTPFGAVVEAVADGIVRITTDITFGGYGSDNSSNPDYQGCVISLEHMLPNGQRFTSLLCHVQCESNTIYDPVAKKGNPKVGQIVKRGDYIAHTGHYWHGAGQFTDWHHIHWAMRLGPFSAASYTKKDLAPYVRGYAPKSEFSANPQTGAPIHPEWLDPLLILQANGDPVSVAAAEVKHLPSGTLVKAPDGTYWLVLNEKTIAIVQPDVMYLDRYDPQGAVKVSQNALDCYAKAEPVQSLGKAWVYVRPGTNTVVIAFEKTKTRHDFIRWEAFLSWGFSQADIITDAALISTLEKTYTPKGYRLLRPGTLVKADEETEVSAVTMDQTRRPIFSGDVFEKLYGPNWQRVVSVPKSVITAVAGPREDALIDLAYIQSCSVKQPCPGGQPECGGGGSQVCAPGQVTTCTCQGLGPVGTQTCLPDGQAFGSCQCPDPPKPVDGGTGGTPSNDGGSPGNGGTTGSGGTSGSGSSSGNGGNGGSSGSGGAPSNDGGAPVNSAVHVFFVSPFPGFHHIDGWGKNQKGNVVGWDKFTECVDANPADNVLECDLPVSGWKLLEFQVYLPNGKYWGDQACDSGGCGKPLGELTLTKGGNPVSYTFTPNQNGPPYYNGLVTPVP